MERKQAIQGLYYPFLGRIIAFLLIIVAALCCPKSAEAKDPPFALPPRSEVLKIRSAILYTAQGNVYFKLFPAEAPWHVANFKYLADKGFYRGLRISLYDPGYILQGGDPKGDGKSGPGYSLPAEFSQRNHHLGTLGMARIPDVFLDGGRPANPERRSNGSQFHILLGDAPHMDSQYTIFGEVVDGFDVLKRLRVGDEIEDLRVFVRP